MLRAGCVEGKRGRACTEMGGLPYT